LGAGRTAPLDEGHQPLIRCKGKKLTFADPLTGNLAETATVKPWKLKVGAVRHRNPGEGVQPLANRRLDLRVSSDGGLGGVVTAGLSPRKEIRRSFNRAMGQGHQALIH
jgi:hypothetical protein